MLEKHVTNEDLTKSKLTQFVLFTLDNQKFTLPLSRVERVARVVEITPLPNAPPIVMGTVNIRGRIIPVVDIRKRFSMSERDVALTDHFIIGRTSNRSVAILVDDVGEIVEISEQKVIKQSEILPGIDYIEGAVKLKGDIVLIHDLDKFLSLEEEKKLEAAMTSIKKKRNQTKKGKNRNKRK